MRWFCPFLFLAALLFPALPAPAMHPAVHHYTVSDGLPQNQVFALIQDADGFLWVGTYAGGAARYDGRSWQNLGTRYGLPSASVTNFSLAPDGTLFVGTTGGPAIWNGRRWRPIGGNPDLPIRPASIVLALSEKEAWLGFDEGPELWKSGEKNFLRPRIDESIQQRRVTSMDMDAQGRILVGMEGGLGLIESRSDPVLRAVDFLPMKPVAGAVFCGSDIAVVYEDGNCWLGKRHIAAPPGFSGKIRQVLASGPGSFCVATEESGVQEYRNGRWRKLGPWMRDGDPPVFCLFRDREGILWIGTDNGLSKVVPSAFQTLDSNDGMPVDFPSYGMDEGRDGSLWFSFWGFGVVCLRPDGSPEIYGRDQGLGELRVSDIMAEDHGATAITLSGLWHLENGHCRKLHAPVGLPEDLRTGIRDQDGTLYLATFSHGLYGVRNGRARSIGAPLIRNVNSLSPGSDGDVMVCGEGLGLARIRGGKIIEHLTVGDGLPSDHVLSVREDRDRTLWVATDRGVFSREPGRKGSLLQLPDELDDHLVYWSVRGPDRALFFGTNHGVLRRAPDGSWRLFGRKDGLGDDECNEGGVLLSSAGRLYVSTLGISVLDSTMTSSPAEPEVFIDSIRLGGGELPLAGEIKFRYSPTPLRLSFVCPSFLDESGTRFLYRMRGLSNDWESSEPGQFTTTYAGLAPGRYDFEVRAVTSDGRRSRNTASVAIRVLPEWWQDRKIQSFIFAVGLLVVLMLIRWRERNFAKIQEELETAVAERTEELREANERLAHLAVTDELTGLPNRRSILKTVRERFSLARRHGGDFSVLMIDIDHFKQVNDVHGHEAGDGALRLVVDAMKRPLRESDVLGRQGGDEFLLLLPDTDLEGGMQAAERIRHSVELEAENSGNPAFRELSVTIGVTAVRPGDTGIKEILARADQALYRAKSAGRNCVREG